MFTRLVVKANTYHDSVVLMSLTREIQKLAGIREAQVGMATDLNKEGVRKIGFSGPEVEGATPNDLVIALVGESEETLDEAEKLICLKLESKARARAAQGEALYDSLAEAPIQEAGIAAISVPGAYAAREARNALKRGLHVFLFSDNVPLEDELALKQLGQREGLLVMGPDCGTAVIGGLGLGFANKVKRGRIGIVAASGTGLQQVLAIIDRLGEGVTEAIGTGGRDLRKEVGGITTLMGLELLERDERTAVKMVISKPPDAEVREKVLSLLEQGSKPAVVCFMGEAGGKDTEKVRFAGDLEEAAVMACSLVGGRARQRLYSDEEMRMVARKAANGKPVRGYLRGLYGGGTLCEETLWVLGRAGLEVYSNVAWKPELRLADPEESRAHTCIDMGDDYFTRGRPHPMLEPGLRVPRYLAEAREPDVGILLFDVVLGYGCHPDPAGVMAEAVREASNIARRGGRKLVQVAVLVGASGDPQGPSQQEKVLRDAGAIVLSSNYAAAELVARVLRA
ncbi:MAG: acyl-CoA synthetase FdrA [Bacillota bacterium]